MFEDLRKPARAMVARAYGKALTDEEIDDVYAAAWTATLSALRTRGQSMNDAELRAYVLTAVASHASKELRRRSRKPAGSLDQARERAMVDGHQPLPEEMVIGSEDRGIARDLLASLPPRRRAVMLLRYGWGLSPGEVCGLVSGLSARAYRKEVTKGVGELIERLRQVESGEWCESREPMLRDYMAGTADEDTVRQVREHLVHCRACASFAATLGGHLHDLGSSVALATLAGSIGVAKASVIERMASLLHGARDSASEALESGQSSLGTIAASGGARGSGAAGAGVLAKVAGLGGAGKTVLACIGAGAAASACVVAGVVPGVSLQDLRADHQRDRDRSARVRDRAEGVKSVPPAKKATVEVGPAEAPAPASASAAGGSGSQGQASPDVSAEPPQEPASPPEPVAQAYDPVTPSPTPTPAPAPSPAPQPSPSPASGGGGSGGSVAGNEFGP